MITKNKSPNNSGFTIVFLLITLPTLLALLTLIYHLVYLFEFKNEFRYLCISESLNLQNEEWVDITTAHKKSTELLQKLKKINSPVRFNVRLANDPKYEPQNTAEDVLPPVYVLQSELRYIWVKSFYLKCGVIKIKKDNQWQYDIIYSTN